MEASASIQLAGVVNDRIYCIPAFPTQGMGPDVFVDVSAKEPEAFFIIVPWTCLLLIRVSRHVDSRSTVHWSRAQFVGILGPCSIRVIGIVVVVVVVSCVKIQCHTRNYNFPFKTTLYNRKMLILLLQSCSIYFGFFHFTAQAPTALNMLLYCDFLPLFFLLL